VVADKQVDRLEEFLDILNADLEPLEEFILPGGTPAAAELGLSVLGMGAGGAAWPPRGFFSRPAALAPARHFSQSFLAVAFVIFFRSADVRCEKNLSLVFFSIL